MSAVYLFFDIFNTCGHLYTYSAGETTYNLDTAGGLRLEVQKYYELIDALRYTAVMADSFEMKQKCGISKNESGFFSSQ